MTYHRYPRVTVSTEWETDSIVGLLAVWRLVNDICKQHGFPDWEHKSFGMRLSFRGGDAEQARALMAAVEGLELPIRVEES